MRRSGVCPTRANVPVVHTFMSKGVVPDSDSVVSLYDWIAMQDHPAVVIEKSDAVVRRL